MNVLHLPDGYKPWLEWIVQIAPPHIWRCSSFLWAWQCFSWLHTSLNPIWTRGRWHLWARVSLMTLCHIKPALLSSHLNISTARSMHTTCVLLHSAHTELPHCCYSAWTCPVIHTGALNRWATNRSKIHLTPLLLFVPISPYYKIYPCQRGKDIHCSVLKVQSGNTGACRSLTIMNPGDSSLWVNGLIESEVPGPAPSSITHPSIPICALHQGWGKDEGDRL